MLAALLPWSLTVKEYKENQIHAVPSDLVPYTGLLDPQLLETLRKSGKGRKLLQKPLFAEGLRIHNFDEATWDFLTRAPRSYCVWHASADGTLAEPGYDTVTLTAVLDECNAKNVGYKSDVRVIFVHVGALPTLRKLQALAMRRCKQADLRIYSYGTHPTVHPDRWGLKELYPIGSLFMLYLFRR